MPKTFKGGVHPDDAKSLSKNCAIETMPLPVEIVLPISQHIGAPAKIIVEKDQSVKKGQVVAEAGGYVSSPVHATVSGKIKAIEPRLAPSGKKVLSVVIENDNEETWADGLNIKREISSFTPEEKINIIKNAGIVGLGGAAFPTHVKLSPPSNKTIDTLIINGVECEPYVTSDYRLMIEHTHEIIEGVQIIMEILKCKKAIIGIEKNKPDVIKIMRNALKEYKNIQVSDLKVKYPQGGEKQLIYAVTKRKVPAGGLPMDVGCVVQNVATTIAVYEAVALNKPLIEKVVTVTGKGVIKPVNLLVRIGTMCSALIEKAGGYTDKADKLINGGPMMGIAQFTDEVPVVKGTSCLLVLENSLLPEESACIYCARCVDICPMRIMPTSAASYVELGKLDEAKEYGVLDCIECGSCSYICPAKRRLVEHIKFGKLKLAEIRAKEQAAKAKDSK